MNVNATGLTHCDDPTGQTCEDFKNHPEAYCIKDERNPLCENVDICEDEGEITSKGLYCSDSISDDPYKGYPEGYHSVEDDESGQCYTNVRGCEYEDMMLVKSKNSHGHSCFEIRDCFKYPNSAHRIDKETYCKLSSNSLSDYCKRETSTDLCWTSLNGSRCNGSNDN